jgi:hypothetical protein
MAPDLVVEMACLKYAPFNPKSGGNIMSSMFLRLIIVFALIISPTLSFSKDKSEDEARTYLLRGMSAVEMSKNNDDLASAVVEFKRATEIAPNMAAAWYNLGLVQAKIGLFKEAIDSFNRYLILAPRARDAQKVKDEVIKLGYQLERAERVKSLTGQWVTSEGIKVNIVANDGKIRINFVRRMKFPRSAEVWWDGKKSPGEESVFDYVDPPSIHLVLSGGKLSGIVEFSGGAPMESSREPWCRLPAEKNPAEGTLDKDRIHLTIKKMKFKVEQYFTQADWLSVPIVNCARITPIGTTSWDMVLTRTQEQWPFQNQK